MQVYLPIAEMSVDAFLLMGIGFGVGWLSGLFGVGGGFLLTPLLILIGIPAPVAVASGANQTLGASVSGADRAVAAGQRGRQDGRGAAGRRLPRLASPACSCSPCCGGSARSTWRCRCSTWSCSAPSAR